MKRTAYCFLLICFIFAGILCTSCDTTKQLTVEESTTESTNQVFVEVPSVRIDDYEAYLQSFKNTEGLRTVVGEDIIQMFGSFQSFVVLSKGDSGDYSQCFYSFKDSSGTITNLYVTDLSVHEKSLNSKQLDYSVSSTNLRFLNNDDNGVQSIEDAEYLYVGGKLLSICVTQEDIEYVITGNMLLSDCPQDTDTFVSKLLQRETAADAISAFRENLKKKS